jgi:creatinine amidohydrolase
MLVETSNHAIMKQLIAFLFLFATLPGNAQKRDPKNKAVYLADISWTTARDLLTPEKIIIIPLGAEAKTHGPHLPLSTDLLQAEECTRRIALERPVIIAPPLNYGYYALFVKFAGSTTLASNTAIESILSIVRGLADFGPKRFYIINQGIYTVQSLKAAARILSEEGIVFYYSDFLRPTYHNLELSIATKPIGGHADEIETSNILSIRPDLVDMKKAEDDSTVIGKTGFPTPYPVAGGILNPSGVKGYSTPATRDKGDRYLKGFANLVLADIDSIAKVPLPQRKDRTKEYEDFVGEYTDTSGTKLVISQKDNILYYVWNNRDLRSFFPLYKNRDDYFSALLLQVLFVRNEKGIVTRAWCQDINRSFWVTKNQ